MRCGTIVALFLAAMLAPISAMGVLAAPSEPVLNERAEPGGPVDIDAIDDATLAGVMANYVVNIYLSPQAMTPEEIEQLYAPRVAYFGEASKSREAIIRDKRAYYTRWPLRSYAIVPDTMEITRAGLDGKRIEVTFQFTFDVRSRRRISQGRATARLAFDFATPGGQIVAEEGDVISRGRN